MANTYSADLEQSSSQYFSIASGDQTGLNFSGDFTIEAWIKLEALPGTSSKHFAIVERTDFNLNGYTFFINKTTNKLRCLYADGGDLSAADVDVGFISGNLDTWMHVAVAVDVSAKLFYFYVNAVLKADTIALNSASAVGTGAENLEIGRYNGADYYDGKIDDVRIWSDIRTAEEIRNNIDIELDGDEANLVGYWKLENDALDATSNDNDLTNNGTIPYTTDVGFSKRSIDLELSSTQYLSITDANQTGLDITGDLTFETWVKAESVPSGSGALLSKWITAANASYIVQYGYYTDDVYIRLINSSTGADTGADTGVGTIAYTFATGTWTHLAVTFDASAGSMEVFINGSSIGSTTGTLKTSIYNGTSPFQIGAMSTGVQYFDGLLDDVRIWSDIRTDPEISDNYQAELVGNEAGLVGYWRLNNTLLDATTNENDLTNNGAAVFSTDVFPEGGGAYTLVVDTMALTLTYNAVLLKAARKLVADTMALALTFNDVVLTYSGATYTLIVDTMALSFTYNAVVLKATRKLIVDTMALAFTFNAVLFKRTYALVANTLAMVFTFNDVTLKIPGRWTNDTKNTSSWTNDSKN